MAKAKSAGPVTADRAEQPEVGAGARDEAYYKARVNVLEAELEEARELLTRIDVVEVENSLLQKEVSDLQGMLANTNRAAPAPAGTADPDGDVPDLEVRTFSFRLGQAIIKGGSSPRALVRLPGTLLALRKEAVEQRKSKAKVIEHHANTSWLIEQVVARGTASGYEQALTWLARQVGNRDQQAQIIVQVARDVRQRSPETAYQLCLEAIKIWPQLDRIKWLSFALFDAGFVQYPFAILERADLRHLSAVEERRINQIKYLAAGPNLLRVPNEATTRIRSAEKSVLWWSKQCLPYHQTSQTLRSLAAIEAMADRGWTVAIATEPGYPSNRSGPANRIERQERGKCSILRLPSPPKVPGNFSAAAVIYAQSLGEAIALTHASTIVCDGDFLHCQAAAYAARRHGLKLVIDLGEISAPWMSALQAEQSPERSDAALKEMSAAASLAHLVLVRSRTVGEVLMARGVPAERIKVIKDPFIWKYEADSEPRNPAAQLLEGRFPVLGHIGHISPARGILELLPGVGALTSEFPDLAFLLAGPTQYLDKIHEGVQSAGLQDRVKLPGRVAPEDFVRLAGEINVWLEPPPMTGLAELSAPLEVELAMALRKPVVAPDTAVFRERLGDYPAAWFYSMGKRETITDAIKLALQAERSGEELDMSAVAPARLAQWADEYSSELARAADAD